MILKEEVKKEENCLEFPLSPPPGSTNGNWLPIHTSLALASFHSYKELFPCGVSVLPPRVSRSPYEMAPMYLQICPSA